MFKLLGVFFLFTAIAVGDYHNLKILYCKNNLDCEFAINKKVSCLNNVCQIDINDIGFIHRKFFAQKNF